MTANATSPKGSPSKTKLAYSDSELYDSPEDLARWPLLAPLLKTWQAEVWEKDHTEFRGCWHYDQEAIRLQQRHRWAVILAAFAGTGAVVLAILKLGLEGRTYLAEFMGFFLGPAYGQRIMEKTPEILMYLEVVCVVLAVVTILLSIFFSLDHRWRELRFKAEHYRMLKFRFLHNGAEWLAASEEARGLHLFTHLTQVHSADKGKILEWIHWKRDLLPILDPPKKLPEEPLASELASYFRERRLLPQRKYFHDRGHQLHRVERIVRWIGPGLFFASVVFALAHASIHVLHHEPATKSENGMVLNATGASPSPSSKTNSTPDIAHSDAESSNHASGPTLLVIAAAFAMAAAISPVLAAGIRTWRGAFEFGRNSLRFEAMAHHLEHLLSELQKSKSPEAMLAILRRGEYAMESEHRAWMRLMMEAEWFG